MKSQVENNSGDLPLVKDPQPCFDSFSAVSLQSAQNCWALSQPAASYQTLAQPTASYQEVAQPGPSCPQPSLEPDSISYQIPVTQPSSLLTGIATLMFSMAHNKGCQALSPACGGDTTHRMAHLTQSLILTETYHRLTF